MAPTDGQLSTATLLTHGLSSQELTVKGKYDGKSS